MRNFAQIRNEWFINQIDILLKKNISKAEIARRLGVKPQYLTPILAKKRNASENLTLKLCQEFDINQNELLNQMKVYEETLVHADIVKEPNPLMSTKSKSAHIPLVSITAIAGFGSADFSIQQSDVKAMYVVPKFDGRKVDFMIEVHGSSMYPKYSSGDVVACTIIKESSFIQWNKVHVIATREQGILVKRLKEGDTPDTLLAVSDNADYPPFLIPKSEITGMALVVGVIRLE